MVHVAVKKRTKQQSFGYMKLALVAAVVVLAVATFALSVSLHHKNKEISDAGLVPGVHISLGSMGYDFSSGKPVKTDDVNTMGLKALLTKEALNDLGHGCASSYYTVKAFNTDKTQVQLGYGCNAPDSPMFAIKSEGKWETLSPTNRFNTFGIPDCTYVTQNNIDRMVAPVCVNSVTTNTPQYSVR